MENELIKKETVLDMIAEAKDKDIISEEGANILIEWILEYQEN